MRFVDRSLEMARLDALVEAGRPGLIVLWGRRRIGKTRLLLEWTRKHRGLYTVADLSAAPIQRRYFAEALSDRFPGFSDVEYRDWRGLFRALAREAKRTRWRGPLVLDEFPYWVEASPELPSVLQNFLDHEAAEAGLVIAVAGSSGHMIQGLTLDPSAPLFGRATAAVPLGPMSPKAMGEALRLRDATAQMQAFAVWGGVPRYWELAEPYGEDLDAAVEELVLQPMGPLHLEPDRLLAEERPPALAVRPLLDAIGAGAHRVSEIAGRLGTAATSLSRGLSRLIELDVVTRERPFGDPPRGGKRSLYKISDPFFRTWFRVVAPHRAALTSGGSSFRRRLWGKHKGALFAETWEELCRRAAPALVGTVEDGAAGDDWTPARRFWRGSGPEWDLVARSGDGRRLLLGEVKWREDAVSERDVHRWFRELDAKGAPPLRSGAAPERIVRALFVPNPPRRSRLLPAGFHLFAAEDVVAALG